MIQTEKSGTLGVSQDQTLIRFNTDGSKSFGFDPQRKAEATGFAEEVAAALVNGTNPGHHNGIVTFSQQRTDEYKVSELAHTQAARDYKSATDLIATINPAEIKYWDGTETVGTITANNANGAQRMPDKQNFNCLVGDSIVRRLTPTECERLQGFPDGWTDIGEWVDTKGKTHKPSDSPRFKALGNSIAIPYWFWLLRRISAQYERPATLGSLFDGIGGFPLCWERCNGKGTAIWASEIEEFPIAVTKRHFPEEEEEKEGK